MKPVFRRVISWSSACLAICGLTGLPRLGQAEPSDTHPAELWDLGRQNTSNHVYSTLFSAQDVRDYLSAEAGLKNAVAWCRKTGVTKVYIESYRDGYRAERAALLNAKETFKSAGFGVSGCVTTTKIGRASNGWKEVTTCYTYLPAQTNLQAIFEYAASLFDEIMIDDFWFTDCSCPDCDAARISRTVTVGSRRCPVAGDSWEDYRRELMLALSRDCLLGPAKQINPNARLIIKYPQWYDSFHERGYDVSSETTAFDRIWVGTETRDYQDAHWGGTVQYEGFFIMRWLGGIGGPKCGGGWFDWLGTTGPTYIEQARQTILGGAAESLLFVYGGLQEGQGAKDVEALRANLPELLAAAKEIRSRRLIGLAAYKPPNSHPEDEKCVFDFVGMLGLPLAPCHVFPSTAPAAFFSVHALKDPNIVGELGTFIGAGKPVLLTDGLAQSLSNRLRLDLPNVHILKVNHNPKSLLELSQAELDTIRALVLRPFNLTFRGPVRVGLYPFSDGSSVVENFRDEPVEVALNGRAITIGARSWVTKWK